MVSDRAGERLDGDVGDAEEDSRRRPEEHAVVVMLDTQAMRHDEQEPDAEKADLEGDHAREGVARVRAPRTGQRDGEKRQAECGEPDPDPLAAAEVEAEDALRENREEDEAACHHGLDDRERRQGHREDVESPRARRDEHAEGEVAVTEEVGGAAAGVLPVDRRRGRGSPVLVEKAQVGGERAQERTEDSELNGHFR